MGLESWSKTPSSNNSSAPNGAPEGWAPSSVNAVIRQQMADHRTQWETAEWFNFGYTHTYASSSSFTISGDYTATYPVGRRIKVVASTPGTIYGTISGSSYSSPNTTVTITFDSGSLSNESLTVYLSILDPSNPSFTLQSSSDTVNDFALTFLDDGTGPAVRRTLGELWTYKPSDTARSGTISMTDDPHLGGEILEPDTMYAIEMALRVSVAAASPGFRMALSVNQAPQEGEWGDAGGPLFGSYTIATSPDTASGAGGFPVAPGAWVYGSGYIHTHASNPTTLSFQWAQGSSSGNATTLHKGSWMKVTKLESE